MQNSKPLKRPFRDHARSSVAVNGLLLMLCLAGCGTSTSPSTATAPATTPQPAGPQNYFAASVAGSNGSSTYTFDDKAATFSRTIFGESQQPGGLVLEAGDFNVTPRGLRSVSISTTYVVNSNGVYTPNNSNPPTSNFALELAGQAGGFAQIFAVPQGQQQLLQQPVVPLVAADACPNFSSAHTYQFITIPAALIPAGTAPISLAWDPTAETAYGSVDITTSGSTVNFQNIQQFKLPSVLPPNGNTGPNQPPPASLSGTCAQTSFGYTTAVPGQAVVTDPGVSGGSNPVTPQAIIGIGPSGLLVEDNGSGPGKTLAGSSPSLPYENVLGAGTGAVGLPKPSGALDTGTMVGAQYLGFIYAAGEYKQNSSGPVWSSHLASFGFTTMPSGPNACPSFPASTSTPLLYGGDFPQVNGQDNPAASPNAPFGNCDFAIDLGTQVSAGLYSNAIVWVCDGYGGDSTCSTDHSFQAVAIAGQLGGKYAIFVIGEDSSQPWAIYLLQSN
jgi:hypothetical protein